MFADPTKRPSMSEEAIASVEGEDAAPKGGKKQTSPEDPQSHQQVWHCPCHVIIVAAALAQNTRHCQILRCSVLSAEEHIPAM